MLSVRRSSALLSWAWGYSRFGMDTALGLILFVVFIACVIGLAAGLTWVVVRLTPAKKDSAEPAES
jgi:hypothetical protein